MIDEHGMMEVKVDGVPQRRQATIRTDQYFGNGLSRSPPRYEPELRSNERVVHTVSGEVFVFTTGE